MPFALIIAGLVLVVAAVQNTVTDNSQTGQKGLVTLVKGDFTGQSNFIYWMVSILVIGALGYIDSLKSFSRIVMALIVVVLFFNGNKQGISFFKNFQQALAQLGQGNFGSALSSFGSGAATPSTPSSTQSFLDQLSTPQSWAQNYQVPSDLGIETPLSSGRITP